MLRSSAGCMPDCLAKSVDPSSVSITRSWAMWRGKPEVHGRVDERLHDEEHVGRAGAGHGGRHRDHLLVVDLELGAEAAQQRRRLRALVLGRLGRGVPDGHPLARAGPACWASSARPGRARGSRSGPSSSRRRAPTGRAGRAQVRPDLAADAVEHLGLDARAGSRPRLRPPRRSTRRSGCRTRARAARAAPAAGGWRRPARVRRARRAASRRSWPRP